MTGLQPRGRAAWMLMLVILSSLLAACRSGVLAPRGPVAGAEKMILFDALAIMLMIVVPVIFATLGFAWWFRASNPRARHLPDWSYSGQLEFIVWAIPALVVMFLGGIAWISSHDLDPWKRLDSTAPTAEIEVVSLDWKWLFIYPEQQIASVNELVVPAGRPLHFRLTSGTVMNSFFVPQLGSQIYTMAGMTSQLSLQADEPGLYRGLSAQFSGDGFSDMHFNVRAVSEPEYEAWICQTRSAAPALDEAAYETLLQPGVERAPHAYGRVEANFFATILERAAPGMGMAMNGRDHQAHDAMTPGPAAAMATH